MTARMILQISLGDVSRGALSFALASGNIPCGERHVEIGEVMNLGMLK